ncbi:MAG: tetratricopeptide repeat protein [Cyanobacteria bacterium SZAS LIN-5]|nr:tetratricopeptide repeat protein [Cyanobacteria bacterium SZAS LIN-5]
MTFYHNAKLAVALSLGLVIVCQSYCDAAARRVRAGTGGGGGGGVSLVTPNPTNPLEHNNRGVELGSKGMWDGAVHEHEEALRGDPYNLTFRQNLSAAYQRYGQSLLAAHKYAEAAQKLRTSIYVDPENRSSDELLSSAIKGMGKNPDDANVRQHLADDFDINGDYVQAIAEYRHYVRMKDSGAAHFALGRVLVKQGSAVPAKLVEGYIEMRTAVTKPWEPGEKNELSKCHAQLGDVLKELAFTARDDGRTQVALKRMLNAGLEYRRAVTLNPLNSDAIRGLIEVSREAVQVNPSFDNHLMLGGAYQLVPDFEHAKREYIECFKIGKQNPALAQARRSFHLAVVSSSQASPTMVAESMQKIEDQLRTNPGDAELLYIYGRGKETLGDFNGAIAAYQRAAQINPNVHPQLQPRLTALMGGGPSKGGTAIAGGAPGAQKGAGGAPGNAGAPGVPGANGVAGAPATPATPPKPAVNYSEGESKLAANDTDGAIKFFEGIIDKTPTDGHAWLLLGLSQQKKGDLDSASVSFRQASYSKEPGAQAALDQVNRSRTEPALKEYSTQLAAKNYVAAASALRDAIDVAPNSADLHRKLADLLKLQGDTKEADKETAKADAIEKGGKAP